MRRALLSAVIGGLAMALHLANAQAPDLKAAEKRLGRLVLSVSKPKTAPEIDGKLDDPCWNDVKPVAFVHSNGAWWDPPSQKTEARVLADSKAIYFAVRCFEAEPERIVEGGNARDGMIVGADTVEVFLDPGDYRKRFDYYHLIVTPNGTTYRGKGVKPEAGKSAVTARVARFPGGWTVEAVVPFDDLGIKDGAIPKTWGLNICRQRPELGAEMPKAAKEAGNKRFDPSQWKLDDPKKYRLAEYTAWSPTMADFCGWPFYSDSRPFHFAERFGHAVLEVGTQDVAPPAQRLEVIFRSQFDEDKLGPFQNAVLTDDSFRGPGKSIGFADGQNTIRFTQPLENLDDVTLLLTLKMPRQDTKVGGGVAITHQRLVVMGEAPDGRRCGAERYEIFLSPEAAEARSQLIEESHRKQFGAGTFELYDTHADMLRWKPCGRVRKGPGPWAVVEGFFAEPSPGQVRWPGKDWVIVRIRPGQFRRDPGPNQGQRLVPREQGYPKGLLFTAQPKEEVRIGEVIVFRGDDDEPPARVTGVKAQRQGEEVELSWNRAADNTLTAFYRVYAGENVVAETHRLTARLKAAGVKDAGLSVVACDLYGNVSPRSEPVRGDK